MHVCQLWETLSIPEPRLQVRQQRCPLIEAQHNGVVLAAPQPCGQSLELIFWMFWWSSKQTNIDIISKTHENPWCSKEHELKSRIFHISTFSTFSQGIFLEGILVTQAMAIRWVDELRKSRRHSTGSDTAFATCCSSSSHCSVPHSVPGRKQSSEGQNETQQTRPIYIAWGFKPRKFWVSFCTNRFQCVKPCHTRSALKRLENKMLHIILKYHGAGVFFFNPASLRPTRGAIPGSCHYPYQCGAPTHKCV